MSQPAARVPAARVGPAHPIRETLVLPLRFNRNQEMRIYAKSRQNNQLILPSNKTLPFLIHSFLMEFELSEDFK